jgi:8-oxo-dGTP pyrophosphatase MutT (NUDIX family)
VRSPRERSSNAPEQAGSAAPTPVPGSSATETAPPAWFERLAAAIPAQRDSPFSRFVPPADGSAKRSAVLVLFGPGSNSNSGSNPADRGPDVLLTQRSAQLRSHAGQIAFPGGRIDPGDAGPEAAALREAVEETGLDPGGVQIRATGPALYVAVTNFLVTPVIGWWRRPSPVAPGDPAEVMRVVRVPLAELVDPENRFQAEHPSGYLGPGFAVGDLFVWGFTAGVLDWVISLAGLERSWDGERRRPIPEQRPSHRTLVAELTEQLDERVSE